MANPACYCCWSSWSIASCMRLNSTLQTFCFLSDDIAHWMILLCRPGGSSSDNNEQVPQGSPATSRGRVWCRPACWQEDIDDVHQQGWSVNVRNSRDHQSRQNLVTGYLSLHFCTSFIPSEMGAVGPLCLHPSLLPTPLAVGAYHFHLILRLDSKFDLLRPRRDLQTATKFD